MNVVMNYQLYNCTQFRYIVCSNFIQKKKKCKVGWSAKSQSHCAFCLWHGHMTCWLRTCQQSYVHTSIKFFCAKFSKGREPFEEAPLDYNFGAAMDWCLKAHSALWDAATYLWLSMNKVYQSTGLTIHFLDHFTLYTYKFQGLYSLIWLEPFHENEKCWNFQQLQFLFFSWLRDNWT